MPRGNPYRCKACGDLASKDRFCKKHRPKKRVNPFRDNFKPPLEYWEEKKEFGAIKDNFGEETKWG